MHIARALVPDLSLAHAVGLGTYRDHSSSGLKGTFAYNGSRQDAFAFFTASALDHHDQVGMRVSFPLTIAHASLVTICHTPPADVTIPVLDSGPYVCKLSGSKRGTHPALRLTDRENNPPCLRWNMTAGNANRNHHFQYRAGLLVLCGLWTSMGWPSLCGKGAQCFTRRGCHLQEGVPPPSSWKVTLP